MVQILLDPVFNEVKITKVDHKSIVIQRLGYKSDCYCPTMSMDSGTSSRMPWLTVGEGNIAIGFTASYHYFIKAKLGFIFSRVWYLGDRKSFFSFDTSPTFPAM
tara:strand:- start:127 stop:438 length:312 start_codon:yes stop_codon:yes gene_type:complete